jgi:hypothetical protein
VILKAFGVFCGAQPDVALAHEEAQGPTASTHKHSAQAESCAANTKVWLRFLLDDPNMPVKPGQISIDADLLRRIDADPEAREKGRSALVRAAVQLYLTAKERRELDARIARAYDGEADAMLDEVAELIRAQEWPET